MGSCSQFLRCHLVKTHAIFNNAYKLRFFHFLLIVFRALWKESCSVNFFFPYGKSIVNLLKNSAKEREQRVEKMAQMLKMKAQNKSHQKNAPIHSPYDDYRGKERIFKKEITSALAAGNLSRSEILNLSQQKKIHERTSQYK